MVNFFTFGTLDDIKIEVKSNKFCCEDAGLAADSAHYNGSSQLTVSIINY